jgi:uncharacterized membrane protein
MVIPLQTFFHFMDKLFKQKYIYLSFLVLMIFAIYFVTSSSANLPPRMASHFNAEGIADGFMSKESYTYTMLSVVVGVPGLLALMALVLGKLPTSLINIPNREYWLTPENRSTTFNTLNLWMGVLACFILIFLTYVHWLVIQANAQQPPAMPAPDLYLGLIFFLVLIGIWSILLLRQFKLPDAKKI